MSGILNKRQIRAVNKLGEIMCPRHDAFPSFTELDAVANVDTVLAELPETDLGDLKLLLTVLSFLPSSALAAILRLLDTLQNLGGPLGPTLRMIRFGLRGIVFSLYYSGLNGPKATAATNSHQVIGYQVHVAPVD
jgi:hypothetical protein